MLRQEWGAEMGDLVSVIVPVYNSENYLKRLCGQYREPDLPESGNYSG